MRFPSQRNDKLGEQLRKVSASKDQQRETNKQLQETLERVREELKTTQVQAERIQQEAERYPRCSLFTHTRLRKIRKETWFLLQPAAGQSEGVYGGKRKTAAEICWGHGKDEESGSSSEGGAVCLHQQLCSGWGFPPSVQLFCPHVFLQRKTKTEYKEKKLQHKIELLEAKIEEQKLEVSLVKK